MTSRNRLSVTRSPISERSSSSSSSVTLLSSLTSSIEKAWQGYTLLTLALIPLSLLYCAIMRVRRLLYRYGLRHRVRLAVPVIVVGNITVGGTGKSPLVIELSDQLARRGWRPGIVTRGYRGSLIEPTRVTQHHTPSEVGDEAVMLRARTARSVAIGRDRPAAAQLLIEAGCNLIISDDGLQHERLARDLEIAVIDGARRLGNRLCLPAGPLREPPARLRSVDLTLCNGGRYNQSGSMRLVGDHYRSVDGSNREPPRPLATLRGQTLHAVAGIGHPERFFRMLEQSGIELIRHPFPDHHPYRPDELDFGDALPVIMTEKDAVKCRDWAPRTGFWYVPVSVELEPEFERALIERLEAIGAERVVGVSPR